MEQQQADRLASWFDSYAAGFYGDDGFANANIKLKDDHSRRVSDEMLYLADALRLGENQKRMARVIGLLHDIGRFEQFEKYRTYSDQKSVNHSQLGVEILHRTGVLGGFHETERRLIEKAIECHGLKELPADLADETLLFARMIRDADKLDVFRVFIEYHKLYTEDPGQFMLETEFADEPTCSPEVVEAILNEQLVGYGRLRTLNDMKLMLIGWVYDINFTATLERIRERRHLETLFGLLPQTEQVRTVRDKIFAYVDSRLRQRE